MLGKFVIPRSLCKHLLHKLPVRLDQWAEAFVQQPAAQMRHPAKALKPALLCSVSSGTGKVFLCDFFALASD